MATAVVIPDPVMRKLLAEFQPGSLVQSADLYARYVRLMVADEQTPASRQALGRAMTRVGCDRKKLRKRRGPRGGQRLKEVHCWAIPGGMPVAEEDGRMAIVLRLILNGRDAAMIPSSQIWDTYQTEVRKRGWGWSMGSSQVSGWLNRQGFHQAPYGGQRGRGGWSGKLTRYVDSGRLDMIAPRGGTLTPERQEDDRAEMSRHPVG